MIVANKDHQHTSPFDDGNETEQLPEELRQVARRYATLQVPRPTAEETNRLIVRLQTSTSRDLPDLSHHSVRLPQRRRRIRPLLEILAAVLMVGLLVGSFLLVLSWRSHYSPSPPASVMKLPVTLQKLHMFDTMNGWALTSTSVLYTRNGWSTWKDVTPHKAALVSA